MPKVTAFTPSICNQIDREVKAALAGIEAKYGIQFHVGGGTYDSESFTTKIKTTLAGVDLGRKEWDRFCFKFGLTKEQFGTTFTTQGETFTVVGIKPKAKQFPVIGQNARGTRFKFGAEVLRGRGFSPR